MANIKKNYTETFVAENSLAAAQYHGVELSGNRQVDLIDSATDQPVGILQNAPGAGEEADVLVIGRTPVVAGDTLTAGQRIMFDASGHAIPFTPGTDITKYCAGIVTIGAAVTEMAEVIINCAAGGWKGSAST